MLLAESCRSNGLACAAIAERARALYGSRIFRLQGATAEKILEEKNCFALFTTGVYRSDTFSKDTRSTLKGLEKKAIAAAKSGDSAGAQAAVKEFVKVGNIRVLDDIQDSIYNPKQRRNAGAPATQDVEAQMGTQLYALYEAKPKGAVVGK